MHRENTTQMLHYYAEKKEECHLQQLIQAGGRIKKPWAGERSSASKSWLHIESTWMLVKNTLPLPPLNHKFKQDTKKIYIKTNSNAAALQSGSERQLPNLIVQTLYQQIILKNRDFISQIPPIRPHAPQPTETQFPNSNSFLPMGCFHMIKMLMEIPFLLTYIHLSLEKSKYQADLPHASFLC